MSDNELDAELLEMAGGSDQSDEEGEDGQIDQTQAFDDHEEAKDSVEKVEEAPKRSTKGVAQKVRRRRAKKQESEDEGGLDGGSPSEADPLDAMDSDNELDAAGSPTADDDGPLYPIEGKYLSTADRDDLLAMPEIQREEILADRAAQVTKQQQNLQLKKALGAAKAMGEKKRKAAAASLDEDGGSGRRTRPKAEQKRTALDDYKKAREAKAAPAGGARGGTDAGGSGKSRRGDRSRSRSDAGGSDRDADGESEVEWAAEPSAEHKYGGRDDPLPELRDYERVRLGRSAFAQICFYPGFEAAALGCYTRVSIGLDRATGQNMYRMAQIKRLVEGKPYQMEDKRGKHFTTDVYAVLAAGDANEKPFPFIACSDGRITDREYDDYLARLRKNNIRAVSRKFLLGRLDAVQGLLHMTWTDEMISKKIANQRAMERKLDPANAPKLKREKISKRKAVAEEAGDVEAVAACEAELAALENAALTATNGHAGHGGGVLVVKPSPTTTTTKKAAPPASSAAPLSQHDRLAEINMKNRGRNVQDVRKALLEEKKVTRLAREKEARIKAEADAAKRVVEERKAAEEKKLLGADLFGADVFGESGTDVSRGGTPVPGRSPKRSRAGTPLNGVGVKREGKGGLGLKEKVQVGAMKKKAMDDDVIGGLDLGIDVEI